MVLTCTGTQTNFLNWICDSFATITYSYVPTSEIEGTLMNRNPFTANLTEVIPDGSIAALTSTLTFPAVNEITVCCSTLDGSQAREIKATVEIEGIYCLC